LFITVIASLSHVAAAFALLACINVTGTGWKGWFSFKTKTETAIFREN